MEYACDEDLIPIHAIAHDVPVAAKADDQFADVAAHARAGLRKLGKSAN